MIPMSKNEFAPPNETFEEGTLNNQGPFFMRNSQLFHEIIVSKRYTKDMEISKANEAKQ